MKTIEFRPDGIGLVTLTTFTENGVEKTNTFVEVIRLEKARLIADAVELYHAIEDVKMRLAEHETYGHYDADTEEYVFDGAKFPSDVIREIAEKVIAKKENYRSIQETYRKVVDDMIAESIDKRDPSYTAEYLIYENGGGDGDPVTITVAGYTSVEALKAETERIVRDRCREYKVAGDDVAVHLTITKASGAYFDSDEFTVSIAGTGVTEQ